MKRIKVIKKLIYILVSIPLFIGTECMKDPNSPEEPPNTQCPDNISQECAMKISIGNAIFDNISDASKNYYYELTTTSAGVLEIEISQVPSNINLGVEVWKVGQYGNIASSYNMGLGATVMLYAVQKQGTFIIKIYDRDHNASSSEKFKLLTTLDVSDQNEYNNTQQDAKLIPLSSNITGKIRPLEDIDYYQFNTTQDGVIDISITQVPSNIDLVCESFKSGVYGNFISSWNNGLGESIFESSLQKQGAFYIKLFDQNNNEMSSQFYVLNVSLDNSDVWEYNNSREDAKLIQLNSDIYAKIRPKDDKDYFHFALPTQSNITIVVNPVPAEIDMDVFLKNSSGSTLQTSTNTGNGVPVNLLVNNLAAGTYYVHLEDGSQNASSTSFYKLRVNN